MAIIKVTDSNGGSKELTITQGLSLMEVLREADYDEVQAICGGSCSCATCHVHILEQVEFGLPVMEEDEQVLLELADGYHPEHSRLSCQIPLSEQHDGLKVLLVDED